MEYNEIKQTEWEFLTDLQGNSIKLYTAPFITAKLQYALNKYFQPAFEKQVMLNLSDDNFNNLMKAQGISTDKIKLSEYKSFFLNEMKNKPLEELTKFNFSKAVDFCLLCIDKQKILQGEDGRKNLDAVLDIENWEIQKPELIEEILNQYSFRFNGTNSLPDGSVGEI